MWILWRWIGYMSCLWFFRVGKEMVICCMLVSCWYCILDLELWVSLYLVLVYRMMICGWSFCRVWWMVFMRSFGKIICVIIVIWSVMVLKWGVIGVCICLGCFNIIKGIGRFENFWCYGLCRLDILRIFFEYFLGWLSSGGWF